MNATLLSTVSQQAQDFARIRREVKALEYQARGAFRIRHKPDLTSEAVEYDGNLLLGRLAPWVHTRDESGDFQLDARRPLTPQLIAECRRVARMLEDIADDLEAAAESEVIQ